MQSVWKLAGADSKGVTAREVADDVSCETRWAYTTVKTLLTRLVAKGALDEVRCGRAAVYRPQVSAKSARRSAFRSLLDRAFGGEVAPMLRFVMDDADLTPKERLAIRRIIEERSR